MQVVVNHLTRMRGGYICVGGLDLETLQHIRPVLREGALPFDLLARYGGPFDMARIVELGGTRPAAENPHIEDRIIVPSRVKSLGTLRSEEFWDLLGRVCQTRLRALFGDDLRPVGLSSCGTDPGKGRASLGCLRAKRLPRLFYVAERSSGKPRIRLRLHDDDFDVLVGVTDLRLYQDDHITPDRQTIERVAAGLRDATDIVLGLGLTRAFASSGEASDAVHWLQVTNVHLASDPTWQLG
jgi:hypothetical protein